MRKWRIPALLFSLLFLLAAAVATAAEPAPAAAPVKPLGVGDKISNLSLTGLDGKNAEVAVDKGLVAIVFFNTSCSACKAEMALLNAMSKQNKALKVIAVSVDAQGAKTTKLFVESSNYDKFAFYIDPEYKSPERFGFSFSPALVVVKDGSITMKHPGFMNQDEEMLGKALLK
jgi:thiol-disulfide isomerase/thioredoxin